MINLRLITVGSLKEQYLRDAAAEYVKRLSAFCKPEMIELRENRLPDDPSEAQIKQALSEEAKKIRDAIPPRAYKVAFCIEGRMMSSEKLAEAIEAAAAQSSDLVFIIGSSYGLDEGLKRECDLRLSVSPLTFPHQLFRVMSLEIIYRAMNIRRGTRYHK